MKKLVLFVIFFFICILPVVSVDKYSKEYLQSKKHISIANPVIENAIERTIEKELKKETGGNFKVKFTGYTLSSLKKGIFKYMEVSGNSLLVGKIPIENIHLKTLTDYNYIDYKKSPIAYKSDITCAYDMVITDESINAALQDKKYKKIINKINNIAYPMFMLTNIKTKIEDNKLYIIMDYNFPITSLTSDRTFIASSELKVEKGKIKAKSVQIDRKYGNLGLDKVANLLNLLNPLEFTLDLMDTKKCNGNIENVNIVDNKIKIDGKIFIKGDCE